MRKECPEFGWGDYQLISTGSPHVLAVLVTWRWNAVVSVHYFAAETQKVTLPIPGAECAPLTNLLTPEHSSPDARGRHAVALEPYGYRSGWGRCSM
jgi:maltose alpha-D-glucosyltransferase/alpha-amylase